MMLAVGFLVIWGGYSVSLWGWCLLRGYDVTLGQLMSPVHPYGSGKGQSWPPPALGADVIFPGGRTSGTTPPSSGSSSPTARNPLQGTNAGMPSHPTIVK